MYITFFSTDRCVEEQMMEEYRYTGKNGHFGYVSLTYLGVGKEPCDFHIATQRTHSYAKR